MEEERASRELEVAGILVKLRRLIWVADRGIPCSHGLRWGARRRRSAGGDDLNVCRPSAFPLAPPLSEQPAKKRRRRDVSKARSSESPAKAPPLSPPRPAAAPETSSPETPLDFCPSGEEADAKAKIPSAAAVAPRLKKPRMKHGELLSNQMEALNHDRRELEKEAAEAKRRLEALKEMNSMLKDLGLKLEKKKNRRVQRQRSPEKEVAAQQIHREACSDLLLTAHFIPAAAAAAPPLVGEDSVAQTPVSPPLQRPPVIQQSWPGHWLNNHVVLHSTPAGAQKWNLMTSQMWRLDAGKDGSRASNLPDLNSSVDKDSGEELPLQPPPSTIHPHPQHRHHCPQLEHHQNEQKRGSPEEQRAARKKRIEMIHTRRRIAAMR